jgi:hypothetical protein
VVSRPPEHGRKSKTANEAPTLKKLKGLNDPGHRLNLIEPSEGKGSRCDSCDEVGRTDSSSVQGSWPKCDSILF